MDTNIINEHMKDIKCFKGTFPVDLIKYKKYTERPISFIINTDPSNKPGEHWVALYINEDNKAEYFDSFGRSPIDLINFLKLNSVKEIIYNKNIIQCLFSSNCGAYCILFLRARNNGINFVEFLKFFNNELCINDFLAIENI